MKQTNNTALLIKSPIGVFRNLYIAPQIVLVELDNEISLALESLPPIGPNEGYNNVSSPDHFNKTPFV